jgi:hypothetical protein
MMKNQKYILVFTFFFLIFNISTASAQELELSATPEVSPTAAPIDYQLPYPGVLPGHFLYTLKNMRDSLMSLLISSPIRKAEFDLLQSDKRFQAAYLLAANEKGDVSTQTISKAQDYFGEAIEKTNAAKKEGMDIHDLAKRLALAQAKHMEVLAATKEKVGEGGKKQFAGAEKREKEFAKELQQLKP